MASELPVEVLVRILAPLPPVDLVAARGVCRWWRAVVSGMEARDRRFRFPCGAVDIVVHQRAVATSACDLVSVAELVYEHGRPHRQGPRRVACTCGALLDDDCRDALFASLCELEPRPNALAVALLRSEYRDRHAAPLPPARWEVLARERALALELWRLADVLQRDVFEHQHDMPVIDGGVKNTWLPCWMWLPDDVVRPQSQAQLCRLVRDLLETDDASKVLMRLSRSADAHAYYTKVDPYNSDEGDEDEDLEWMDAWRIDTNDVRARGGGGPQEHITDLLPPALADSDHRAPGWQRWQYFARRSAACWRLHVRECRAMHGDDDRAIFGRAGGRRASDRPWFWRSADEKTACKDGQVAAIDSVKRDVQRLCRYATVVHRIHYDDDYTSQVWFGGLSPGGHLVGCLSLHSSR